MTNTTHVRAPELNRLRAAAALIPIIEAGLIDSKISAARASQMASFCEWATEIISGDPSAIELAQTVGIGLKRVRATLASIDH
jgi:hypothetical protein